MIRLSTPKVAYADPWHQPLPERLAAMARGRQRVAYFYGKPDSSTFRYRAYNMVQALERSPDDAVRGGYFFRHDLDHLEEIAELADVLVVCREGYDHGLAALMARFRSRGKRVLFDIDDFVFNTDFTHLLMDTLCVDKRQPEFWRFWFSMMASLGATAKRCDGSITTNDHLARLLRDFTGHEVTVVPNFMNQAQLTLSAAVFEEKQTRHFRGDDAIVFGYFSGSPSHQHDFAIVEPALCRLMERDPRVRLLMVGYIEPGPALQRWAARIDRQPMHDFVNLQHLIGSVEYNLMPLQANAFTDSKSALKYFEAAAVGTVSIASPSFNYAAAIRHGHTGLLARAHEWERMLDQALAQREGYARMAEAARADALAQHGPDGRHTEIAQALGFRHQA